MDISNMTPYIPSSDSSTDIASKLEKAYTEKDDKKLKEACKDFESIFVNILFKEMRSSVPESDLMPKSFATQTFEDMLDEKISGNISKGSGIGIADMMYKQMSKKLNATYKVSDN
jgi:flagellar protein FlgJ